MSIQAERSEMHDLIETLTEEQLDAAKRYVEFVRSGYGDMLLWVLDTAPEDDEPVTPEEEAAIAEAREDIARGRVVSGEAIKRLYPA
jgi:hypothetical protein